MADCKSTHRSFTFPHAYGEPFNAVKRSKREYHYTGNKVMACKPAIYFTAHITRSPTLINKCVGHGVFTAWLVCTGTYPTAIYCVNLRFLFQGSVTGRYRRRFSTVFCKAENYEKAFYKPIKAHLPICFYRITNNL